MRVASDKIVCDFLKRFGHFNVVLIHQKYFPKVNFLYQF